MRLGKHFVCGLLLLSFCSLPSDALAESAATKHSTSGYTNRNIDDALRQVLRQNPALGSVEASVSRGTVILTGEVAHYQDRIDAEALAHQGPGVYAVQNHITLNTPAVDDAELEDRLEDRLRFARADIGLSFPQIQVEAHSGVVSLSGAVKGPIEHGAALSLVGTTDGVVSIKDRLTVDSSLQADDATRIRINKAVYRALRADGEVETRNVLPVRATFDDGTVILMGAVSHAQVKEDLLTKVRDAVGVSNLEDEIFVGISGSSPIDQTASRKSSPCVPSKEVANGDH